MKAIRTICTVVLFVNIIYAQNCIPSIGLRGRQAQDSIILVDCSNPLSSNLCLKVNIDHTDFKTTSDYKVSSIPYVPITSFSSGTKVSIDKEDKFSDLINLPFNFCFYENTYQQLVVGNNGVVSFNPNLANQSCPWNIVGNIPDANLVRNAIFGAFHDLSNGFSLTCQDDPTTPQNECGEISTQVIGTYPCRKFVINYSNMAIFNCAEGRSTFQIVLYEGTNIIDLYIESKPSICDGAKEEKTLMGIQDSEGIKGLSPIGRNTGLWSSHKEAWRFSPSGTSQISYIWRNKSGKIISNEKNPILCNVQEDEVYTVEIDYQSCGPDRAKASKSFYIKYGDSYPVPKKLDYLLCDFDNNGVEILNLNTLNPKLFSNTTFKISYYNSIKDAENKLNPILDPVIITTNLKIYYYRLENAQNCHSIGQINTQIGSTPENKLVGAYKVCDIDDDKTESINLADLIPVISGTQKDLSIEFFNSLADAQNNINNIDTFIVKPNSSITVKISRNGICDVYTDVKFQLIPVDKSVDFIEPNYICIEPNTIYTHDFTTYQTKLPNYNNYDFSYFLTQEDANNNVKSIVNPAKVQVTQEIFTVFVRAQQKGNSCFVVHKITIKVIERLSVSRAAISQCDTQGIKYAFYNLTSRIQGMLQTKREAIISFYKTEQAAIIKDPKFSISNEQAKEYKSGGTELVYVRFEDTKSKCVSISTIYLELILFPAPPSDSTINICVDQNGKITSYNPYTPNLNEGTGDFTITWHPNENEANNNGLNTNPNLKPDSVWVRVSYSDCFRTQKLKINYSVKKETILPGFFGIDYCDQLNDKYEEINLLNYSKSYFPNNSDTNIAFYQTRSGGTYQNIIREPYKYNIFSGNDTIYAVTSGNICEYTVRKILFKPYESLNIKETRVELCLENTITEKKVNLYDYFDFIDKEEGRNLSSEIYLTQEYALQQNPEYLLTDVENTILKIGVNIFWVRLENQTGCYDIKPLTIVVRPFPKVDSEQIICDNDNNGLEENFVLANLNKNLVPNINVNNLVIKYYKDINDATQGINEIKKYTIKADTKLIAQINNGICINNTSITFKFIPAPVVNSFTVDNICDYQDDDQEYIDLRLYQSNLINNQALTDFRFEYFKNENDALNGLNIIQNINNYLFTITDNKVYVRIYNINQCYSIATITLNLFSRLDTKDATVQYICDVFSNTSGFINLEKYVDLLKGKDLTNVTIKYYIDFNDAVSNLHEITNPTKVMLNQITTIFYVKFIDNIDGCYSIKKLPINLQLPPKLVEAEYEICDNDFDGKHDLILSELNHLVILNPANYNFTYYLSEKDALSGTNELNGTERYSTYTPVTIYIKVDNNVCNDITKVILVANKITPTLTKEITHYQCEDDNGEFTVDLNQFETAFVNPKDIKLAHFDFFYSLSDAENNENAIINPKSTKVKNQTIFVRIYLDNQCPTINKIKFIVKEKPIIIMPDQLTFCANESITIDAGLNLPSENYLWSNGQKGQIITVNKPGDYTVSVTGLDGCVVTKTIKIIAIEIPIITKLIATESSIRVVVDGDENNYEYSIDNGKTWQKSSLFETLTPGKYTFIVKSLISNCISNPRSTIILNIKNAITPNEDGFNDKWIIDDLEVFEGLEAKINIFDRYGKIVYTQNSTTKIEWNGKYLDQALSSSSYWYNLQIPDGREYTGYIVVKNRN